MTEQAGMRVRPEVGKTVIAYPHQQKPEQGKEINKGKNHRWIEVDSFPGELDCISLK
jgi:hypothetical protein